MSSLLKDVSFAIWYLITGAVGEMQAARRLTFSIWERAWFVTLSFYIGWETISFFMVFECFLKYAKYIFCISHSQQRKSCVKNNINSTSKSLSASSQSVSSVTQSCPTLCDPMNRSTPGLPVRHQLLGLTHSCSLSQWCHPAISFSVVPFSPCPQSLPASGSSNESVLHIRWPKYWNFSFSISPSNEYSGLISFRMDWLDLTF